MNHSQIFGKSLESRSARRGLIVTLYGSFLCALLVKPAIAITGIKWLLALAVPPMIVGLVAWYYVYQFTAPYAIQKNCASYQPLADERQAQVRDRAMARSYLLISLGLIMAALWMSIAADNPRLWRPATYNDWNLIFWGVMLVTSSLPQALILWQEPDLVETAVMTDGLLDPSRSD